MTGGMGHGEGRSARRSDRDKPDTPKRPASERLRDLWPDISELIRPRRGLLFLGFVLIIVNRVCGLVLPSSTKYLVANVINQGQIGMLGTLTLVVLGATAIQGVTSFTLTQLLSIEGQKLIAELRAKVQQHVGRLPVTYYDANKTGQLVSRIMSDVEGVRNLIGTGLVDFFGGVVTALFSLVLLLQISPLMTLLALSVVLAFGATLSRAFRTIRPIFRERGKISAEVTGRLTESLGGVRGIKGYHAEAREASVFADGVQRLLDNVRKSLTAMSVMSLSATVLMGIVGALVMYLGAHSILAGKMTTGDYFKFVALLAFLVAPIVGVVIIGAQISEALAGLERTREVLAEKPEDQDPGRTLDIGPIRGAVAFDDVTFAYTPGRDVLHNISFHSEPDTVTAFVGPSGSGKSTTIGLISAFY